MLFVLSGNIQTEMSNKFTILLNIKFGICTVMHTKIYNTVIAIFTEAKGN